MSAEEVAKAFVQHFYQAFDADASQLAGLYAANSMLTFEGNQLQGTENIVNKLKSFGQVQHTVKGSIKIGGDNPLHFCEMFQLVSTQPGAYYVHNDIFRLNYGL